MVHTGGSNQKVTHFTPTQFSPSGWSITMRLKQLGDYALNLQCLEELDLESCGYRTGVTDSGVIAAVSGNRSRKKLNLGRLTNVSDQSIVFVAGNCPNLEILDLSGSYVTGAGVRAFSGHRCLQSLDLRMCSEFRLSDIEHMVLGCQSLKSIVLSNMIKETIPESLSRIVKFADELWL
ncbi:hypothetical protein ACLB2K_009961 [Fragaria x ananassa]